MNKQTQEKLLNNNSNGISQTSFISTLYRFPFLIILSIVKTTISEVYPFLTGFFYFILVKKKFKQ